MPRNPKSDIVHKHNALLGSVAFAKSGMDSVALSVSASHKAKDLAAAIWIQLDQLQAEIKHNPQY